MKLKPFPEFLRLFSFGLLMILAILLLASQTFDEVKGEEFARLSYYTKDTNTLTSQISLINEELLKDNLSAQMRTSLTEKLDIIQNYADKIVRGVRTAAIKDDSLVAISPEANDPPFQQGIFPGGEHLLREYAFTANNYFQTKYKDNYIQVIAGKNLSTRTGALYMIITSSDRINSEMINIELPESINDLAISIYEENTITLVDQDHQIYRFDLESKRLYLGD